MDTTARHLRMEWAKGRHLPKCPEHSTVADELAHCEVCDCLWLLHHGKAEDAATTAQDLADALLACSACGETNQQAGAKEGLATIPHEDKEWRT